MPSSRSGPVETTTPETTEADALRDGALVRPPTADAPERTIMVALEPAAVVERLVALDGMKARRVAADRAFMLVHHEGTIFYERTPDGLVLWRRPTRPRWKRGIREPFPYPELLEVRVAAIPRGSRIELRWRPHPLTRIATRRHAGLAALWLLVGAALVGVGPAPQLVVLMVAASGLWVTAVTRTIRDRRALRPLLPRLHAALAPHELGAADLDGSAFRALPAAGADPRPSAGRRRR